VFSSCEVRKPSKKWTNGTRVCRVATCATSARSWASCTDAEASSAKPVWRTGHHVRVVAEDREPLRASDRAATWSTAGGQLAGDPGTCSDHQQQALRGGERRRQRAGLERAVQRAGGAALALHLDDRGTLPQTFACRDSTTRRRARPSWTTA
jgi:hypothetical protein